MGISVIGATLGRTGTKSLKFALERLGFGPCHHMIEVFEHPEQLPGWQAAIAGEPADWEVLLRGYNACVDYPSSYFWRELADAYPDAKVILTMRTFESWWESYSNTFMIALENTPDEASPHVTAVREMSAHLWRMTMKADLDDKAAGVAAYEKHAETVTATIAPDRLLCFDVRDGWGPLCEFLGTPVPDEAFPRANKASEFWERR